MNKEQQHTYFVAWKKRNPDYMENYLRAYSKTEKRKLYMKDYLRKHPFVANKTPRYLENARNRARLHNLRNPDKYKARYTLRNAIVDGKVLKPKTCSLCNSAKRIQAHHHDYSKPLDVVWLCYTHHKELHIKQGVL